VEYRNEHEEAVNAEVGGGHWKYNRLYDESDEALNSHYYADLLNRKPQAARDVEGVEGEQAGEQGDGWFTACVF